MVSFLFFCPWRVGAARRLEWRDYSEADQALTLRRELNKTKREMRIPVDPEHAPELMAVIDGQKAHRRPSCPFIFQVWDRACTAIGMAGRIPHDLRRSGVKHYIDAGADPHSVMLWSGHRTESMLRRYRTRSPFPLRATAQRRQF